jgi:hypothetical protein
LNIVFLSVDYRSLLKYRKEIKNVCGLTCTDPLYAIYNIWFYMDVIE